MSALHENSALADLAGGNLFAEAAPTLLSNRAYAWG
jgi:hypothetical protein